MFSISQLGLLPDFGASVILSGYSRFWWQMASAGCGRRETISRRRSAIAEREAWNSKMAMCGAIYFLRTSLVRYRWLAGRVDCTHQERRHKACSSASRPCA